MRLFDRTTPPRGFTLMIAAATGSLAINVHLPALPGIAQHFQTGYAVVQLTLSIYLVSCGILQLVIGPLSDRYGRRPVMLCCFMIFVLSAGATIIAPSIEWVLFLRVLQASAIAGQVLSRAVVRDTMETDAAASQIAYITMGMSLVPMIGPAIGGGLDELFGWQATFALMFAFGIFAFAIVWFDLGETNSKKSASFVAQISNYPELLASRRFWGYTLAAAATTGTFYGFLGTAPFVASQILNMSPSGYGLYFALISVGYIAGNYCTTRFSRRYGINVMLLVGTGVALAGTLLSITLKAAGYFSPILFFGPVMLLFGHGLILPNANSGIVSVRPHLAGTASGLGGAMQVGGGGTLSFFAATLVSVETGPMPLLLVMLGSTLVAVFAALFVLRITRQEETV